MSKYFNNVILKNQNNISYFKSKRYPNIPYNESDIYLITQVGDRLDNLSYQYYKDPSYYWIISITNNLKTDSLFLEPGIQIRISLNLNEILNLFKNINF